MTELAWPVPRRGPALWHAVKVALHVLRRGLLNLRPNAPRRWQSSDALRDAPVLAEQRSPLWTDGRAEEFLLVAGKVQNLRVAARAFDGVVVPAGRVLSFWRQLGRPSRWRGFVEGREVLGGCMVPTIGGGLCQLSNALESCARQAGIEWVERHAHSARAQDTALADDDATVAWNYVDLRLRVPSDSRFEVSLSDSELIVRLRGQRLAPDVRRVVAVVAEVRPVARGCMTCHETSCLRHRARDAALVGRRAVPVDAVPPELLGALDQAADVDWFMPWVRPARRAAAGRAPPGARVFRARLASWLRMLQGRQLRGEGGARQAAVLQGAERLARAHARRLRPEHTELMLTQELLVPLWRSGALGGRRFDVFMNALPARELQARLDVALRLQPGAASLGDFRAERVFADDEMRALAAARSRVTAHEDVARVLEAAGLAVRRVPWASGSAPARWSRPSGPPVIVFPASALPRKGALEMADAARVGGWRVLVLGTPASDSSIWHGVAVAYASYGSDWLRQGHVAALPAHVEHRPRALLLALSAGMPVVATPACGLPAQTGLIEVPAGDATALHRAIEQALRQSSP